MQTTSTKTRTTATPTSSISALVDRLNHWRSVRSRGHRIPEHLWKAATDLARAHGIAPVSAALKLNYYDIQHRLGMPRRPRKPRVKRPDFVELPPPVSPSPARDSSIVGTLGSPARPPVRRGESLQLSSQPIPLPGVQPSGGRASQISCLGRRTAHRLHGVELRAFAAQTAR